MSFCCLLINSEYFCDFHFLTIFAIFHISKIGKFDRPKSPIVTWPSLSKQKCFEKTMLLLQISKIKFLATSNPER